MEEVERRVKKKDLSREDGDLRGAIKHKYSLILDRWQNDETYRNSQEAIGWDEAYCTYLDYLNTVDISYKAANNQ